MISTVQNDFGLIKGCALNSSLPDLSLFKLVLFNVPKSENNSKRSSAVTPKSRFDIFNLAGSDELKLFPFFLNFNCGWLLRFLTTFLLRLDPLAPLRPPDSFWATPFFEILFFFIDCLLNLRTFSTCSYDFFLNFDIYCRIQWMLRHPKKFRQMTAGQNKKYNVPKTFKLKWKSSG